MHEEGVVVPDNDRRVDGEEVGEGERKTWAGTTGLAFYGLFGQSQQGRVSGLFLFELGGELGFLQYQYAGRW